LNLRFAERRCPRAEPRRPVDSCWLDGCDRDRAMTLHRQNLGKLGENLAVELLTRRGYAILERRYRTRHGEIDIVAEERGVTVFVEVRARATREFGTAAESVTPGKRRKVIAMATEYVARHQLVDRPCRFDVVAIDDAESDAPAITLYPGAFDATG
jgi:putative endonuclease